LGQNLTYPFGGIEWNSGRLSFFRLVSYSIIDEEQKRTESLHGKIRPLSFSVSKSDVDRL